MSPVKEPTFYCSDLGNSKITRREYEMLFCNCGSYHKAIGEASTSYLFSQTAVPAIEKELAEARYIVMLRNPVEMAYSFHEELCVLGSENIKKFSKAWRLSEVRAKGLAVTRWCREPRLLDYKSVCRLGEQVERLYSMVPSERVHVLVLDDIKENPRLEYLNVLNFLGVSDDGKMEYSVKNSAKEQRLPWLQKTVKITGKISENIKERVGIPITRGTGFLQMLKKSNIRYRPRPLLSIEMRKELTCYFKQDILRLSNLLNRDFSGWTKCDVAPKEGPPAKPQEEN